MGSSIDVGDQDATAIFYTTDEHKTAAELSKQQLGSSGKFKKPIATAVLPAGKVSSSSSYDCRGIVSYLDEFPPASLPGLDLLVKSDCPESRLPDERRDHPCGMIKRRLHAPKAAPRENGALRNLW